MTWVAIQTCTIAVQVWLTVTMSSIFVLPALLVSIWFAGLFPAAPYRTRVYT